MARKDATHGALRRGQERSGEGGKTHPIHFGVDLGDARDDAGVKCRCSQFFVGLQFTSKKSDQDRKRTFRLSRRYLESPLVVFLDEK